MQRSKRTTRTITSIAIVAFGLFWGTAFAADPWFGWRKPAAAAPDKASRGTITATQRAPATTPSKISEATAPAAANRLQAAPVSAGAQKLPTKHWWNRDSGKSRG